MKTPEKWAGLSGVAAPRLGTVVYFQTMDELRVFGPVALREWIKRNRPLARGPRRTGEVLEFLGAGHQTAGSSESAGG